MNHFSPPSDCRPKRAHITIAVFFSGFVPCGKSRSCVARCSIFHVLLHKKINFPLVFKSLWFVSVLVQLSVVVVTGNSSYTLDV